MLRNIYLGVFKKLKSLPPEIYVKIYYEYYTGKKLNLNNPIEFNEKIQWLKVYYKNPVLNTLVDKYAVRAYVEQKIGPTYLNELLGVYHSAQEVDFDALPHAFVLKAAHGYNFNLIVKDKSKLDLKKARLKMFKWMNRNQYWRGGLEWAYKDVKPKIIAEQFLEEIGKGAIDDYKFHCFNGLPKFIHVDTDRDTVHSRCYYDLNWCRLPFNSKTIRPNITPIERPQNLEEMLEVSRKLAEGFPFVRVDLYNLNGKILFGEMTFYPGDGRTDFSPDAYNKTIGDMLELPKKQAY
jgi:hypothetical protein